MIGMKPTHSFAYDGLRINVFHALKGQGIPKHAHNYSHATICHNGSCVIRTEEKERVITKDDGAFNLIAGKWHEIEALEDNTVFENIFADGKY